MLFALECSDCAMWELNVVEASICMMVGGGHWHLHEVDQCAFGRLERKPTKILTNIDWLPEGITSEPGCCVMGECAGTRGKYWQLTRRQQTQRPDRAGLTSVAGRQHPEHHCSRSSRPEPESLQQ